MMNKIKGSRTASMFVILVAYILAILAGLLVFSFNKNGNDILYLLLADTVATVIVYLFSVIFSNSSVYDPYWSVAPPVMLTFLAFYYGVFSVPSILLLIAIWAWAIRLTGNWMYTFPNLLHQDWRYIQKREENPGRWQLVNFMGIHYMPTIIVFAAMVPAFYLLRLETTANIFTYIAFLICITATVLQLITDNQMHRFRKERNAKICTSGLWKYSRHPNYLGEILLWWGVYLLTISVAPQYWWTFFGPLVNNLLFVFISIPLMEQRQLANKPEYAEYVKITNALLPKFRK